VLIPAPSISFHHSFIASGVPMPSVAIAGVTVLAPRFTARMPAFIRKLAFKSKRPWKGFNGGRLRKSMIFRLGLLMIAFPRVCIGSLVRQTSNSE
jgi:hypothetical protein